MLLISFSCLITVARTSNTMLSNSGDNGHLYVVPELSGDAFSFSPLKIKLSMGFIERYYYLEEDFFHFRGITLIWICKRQKQQHNWVILSIDSMKGHITRVGECSRNECPSLKAEENICAQISEGSAQNLTASCS